MNHTIARLDVRQTDVGTVDGDLAAFRLDLRRLALCGVRAI